MIMAVPEIVMIVFSAASVLLAELPPHLTNFLAMLCLVIPNILQPLGCDYFIPT